MPRRGSSNQKNKKIKTKKRSKNKNVPHSKKSSRKHSKNQIMSINQKGEVVNHLKIIYLYHQIVINHHQLYLTTF